MLGQGGCNRLLWPPCPSLGSASRAPPSPQAFSSFYYTFHFLNLTSGLPLAAVNASIWEFCQRPWKLVGGSRVACPTWAPAPGAAGSTGQGLVGPHPGQCGRGLVEVAQEGGQPQPSSSRRETWAPLPGGLAPRGSGGGALPSSLPPGPQVDVGTAAQDPRLRDYCASGLYILTLLLEGYGFREETWGGIEFRKQVAAGARVGRAPGQLPWS